MVSQPPEPMTNRQTLEKLIPLASSAPMGCFVEIGVAQGGTSYLLYKIAEKQGRQLHLFDLDFSHGDHPVKKWCPKAILHSGRFPETWVGMSNVGFCFFDIADINLAKFLLSKVPTDFVKKGIAIFYPYNKNAIDYNKYPDWGIVGGGNMRYPYIENRG